MDREELRQFFANCKLCTNISFGKWLDRHHIYRPEFTNFMKGKYSTITTYELEQLKDDILDNIIGFAGIYRNIV